MASITNKEIMTSAIRIAIIFLLVGIFCGSGLVLCIADFIPLTGSLIKIFSSIAVIGALILGIVAYEEFYKLSNVLKIADIIQFKHLREREIK